MTDRVKPAWADHFRSPILERLAFWKSENAKREAFNILLEAQLEIMEERERRCGLGPLRPKPAKEVDWMER